MASIGILTATFFDFDGGQTFNGGGERYLMELAGLLRDEGRQVEIFQAGHRDWERQYDGFTIRGMTQGSFVDDTFPDLNRRFQVEAAHCDHHIYFAPNLAYPQARPDSISISHGIWFDDIPIWGYEALYNQFRRTPQWSAKMLTAIENVGTLVSCDTNTMNWLRTVYSKLERRCEFIPNFVDLAKFPHIPRRPDGKYRVLFPRRLSPQRGWYPMLVSALSLAEYWPDLEFQFLGRGMPDEEADLAEQTKARPNILYAWAEPDEMPGYMQRADVIVIPTLAAEGTSLACLEAMATGRPVVASWVGGLANLIIHEYNGLMVKVTPFNLTNALLWLRDHPERAAEFVERSLGVAVAHSREVWRDRWRRVFKEKWGA